MGVIERLFGRAAPAATQASPGAAPPASLPYMDDRAAAGLNAVWRCVSLIADTIADMPWSEWRGDEQLVPSRLVLRPYANMTRREWTARVVAAEALDNIVYLLHSGGYDSEGAPWSLLPVPSSAIIPTAITDPWGIMPPASYMVGSQPVTIDQLTIIRRMPWPNVADDALSVLKLAKRQFQAFLAADYAAARYWANGGPKDAVITTEQELDDGQAESIGRRWDMRRALGVTPVLGKGASAAAWGADPTAEAAVEARREMVADIGRYFGVPTRILNAPAGDSETYANVEQDATDLYRYTLRGYMGPIEDAISEVLPGSYLTGRRMRMDPATLLQGDLASRATAWSALVTSHIATVPEARVRGFGLPPAPDQSAQGATEGGGGTAVAVTTSTAGEAPAQV